MPQFKLPSPGFRIILCAVTSLMINSCALLLITEPDEQALRYQKKSGCSDCERKKSQKKTIYKPTHPAISKIDIYKNQLSSSSDAVRSSAATQIGLMGPDGASAVAQLEHAVLYDPSKWVRRASVKALYKIGSRSSLRVLETATKDTDHYVKMTASQAVSKWKQGRARMYP
jgi:hypothetical protein